MRWIVFTVTAVAYGACLNGHPSVAKEYKDSTAVVLATVLTERLVPSSDNDFYYGTIYQIRVDRRFRGALGEKAEIFSENSSGRFPMKVGSRYLLFIYTANSRMQVDYCGNSGLLVNRTKELRELERLANAKR
jgi:hypothetical protein